ncbi:nuclear RNA export factor 1-like [Chrysoperla carnea]|uniref:nuclear RNA export factor 1-like n=1 Tax=Chrysoperla carnea TaxID=189513 RepID=UPI001D087F58|nr:nuclear RNA export factor 1-like [Chrysoperla carnea]
MSKKFGKNKNWNNHYDARNKNFGANDNERSENIRRVSFKQNNRTNRKQKQRDWDFAIKSHLDDEDIPMTGGSSGSQGNFHPIGNNRRRGGNRVHSPAPRGGGHAGNTGKTRKLLEGPTSWYKVTIFSGALYDKQDLLRILLGQLEHPESFIPINWRNNGPDAVFFVDDFKIATKIFNSDKKIVLPDGRRLGVRVFHALPQIEINDRLKEKMKLAMAKRYNPATKALDLTKFHVDAELQDVFCALFRAIIMNAAIDVIAENIPDLEALNLCQNRLYVIDHLSNLAKKLPNLKILHIGNNEIRDIRSLDKLKGLQLVDLVLDGNPLCDKFKDQSVYVSEVRKRFPKVIKLDGVDLPPPIVFDVTEECKLPPTNQTFLCNDAGGDIVRVFLKQYFEIYDSNNRQPLLQAYHENGMFSMTMGYPHGLTQKNSPPLNWYQLDNRNLLRVQNPERRNKLLKQGQLSIVSFLAEMPKTQHDMNSFKVDLSFFTPQFFMLNVSGIFKEIGGGFKTPPLRAFTRALIIVAANSGFCIINEAIYITNATDEQAKDAFKMPNPIIPTSPQVSSPTVPAGSPPELDDATKQQMVHTMAQQSGMNLDFSTKCLQETNWDFQRAVVIFTELHKQGGIPPEAFVK